MDNNNNEMRSFSELARIAAREAASESLAEAIAFAEGTLVRNKCTYLGVGHRWGGSEVPEISKQALAVAIVAAEAALDRKLGAFMGAGHRCCATAYHPANKREDVEALKTAVTQADFERNGGDDNDNGEIWIPENVWTTLPARTRRNIIQANRLVRSMKNPRRRWSSEQGRVTRGTRVFKNYYYNFS